MAEEPVIFVVDDDDAFRDSVRALLEAAGRRVSLFNSGQAFLESRPTTRYGCLLLDVRMPGRDGIDVLQDVVRDHPGLPVIMVTGHGDVPLAVQAMKQGAVDFIEKPFKREALANSIELALRISAAAENRAAGRQDAAALVARLTAREREVFECVVRGLANKLVARELDISPRTVEAHRARVLEKMQVTGLLELVRIAEDAGIPIK